MSDHTEFDKAYIFIFSNTDIILLIYIAQKQQWPHHKITISENN